MLTLGQMLAAIVGLCKSVQRRLQKEKMPASKKKQISMAIEDVLEALGNL